MSGHETATLICGLAVFLVAVGLRISIDGLKRRVESLEDHLKRGAKHEVV